MSSQLSAVPGAKRRQVAATMGLFAVLFVAVGAVALTAQPDAVVTAFAAIAFAVALLLALMAWGVAHSLRTDRAAARAHADDARVDAAIEAALAANGKSLSDFGCGSGCGHDHDPEELIVTDDTCAHDGDGRFCSHTCDTCVFARLESVPASAALPERSRPRPTPRRPQPR